MMIEWSGSVRIVLAELNYGVLDLAARFGLETDEFVNPVIFLDEAVSYFEQGYSLVFLGGEDIWSQCIESYSNEDVLVGRGNGQVHLLIRNEDQARWLAASGSDCIPGERFVKEKKISSLTELFSLKGFLGSMDYPFPDSTDIGFRIERELELRELGALAGLASRFGFESTGMVFPLDGESLVYIREGEAGVKLLGSGDIEISGGGEAFLELIRYLSFESIDPFWQEYVAKTEPEVSEKKEDRRWEYVISGEERGVFSWVEENLESLSGEIIVFVSEPVSVRERLAKEIGLEKLIVLPTYKTGLFWLQEVVNKEIANLELGKLKIGFKVLEMGSRGKGPWRDGLLDPPIRWLQEIYPIDDLLEVPLEFEGRWPESECSTYVVEGYDTRGNLVYMNSLDVPVKERAYLERFPDRGRVLVTQGGISVDGSIRYSFPTQVERFWDLYEKDVLPVLESMVREDQEEVFAELVVRVSLREEELVLPVRQERISVLESLHEDIYFKTLDFFRLLGEERFGKALLSPGKVLPRMKLVEEAEGKVEISLRESKGMKRGVSRLKAIRYSSGLEFEWDSQVEHSVAEVAEMSEEEFLERVHSEIIGPKELPVYLNFLQGLGVMVFNGGESEEGRQIPVIVLGQGVLPTVLIKARHHANEVSSTNTALWLAYLSKKDKEVQSLLERVNVVLIPMENPDGAKIHQELNSENPGWSHHAARYNSRGYEFGYDYHKEEKAKEAEVLASVYYRFLPDMIIDDHGVPSHEWVQFLSGYSAGPMFQSYWLPRAMVYGIMPLSEGVLGKYQMELMEFVGRGVKEKYSSIYQVNQEWLEIYNRYASRWLPQEFTYQGVEGMIFYQWPQSERQFSQRFPSVTFADWVTEVGDETAEGEYLKTCIEAHLAVDMLALEYVAGKESSVVDEVFSVGDSVWRRKRRIRFWRID